MNKKFLKNIFTKIQYFYDVNRLYIERQEGQVAEYDQPRSRQTAQKYRTGRY